MPTNRLLAALAALLLSAGTARAAPPGFFTYSGFLMDGAGTAPQSGAHTFHFSFYTAATAGAQVGTGEVDVSTTVGTDGFFSAVIDVSTLANNPLFRDQLYMAVRVDGDAAAMTPRVRVTSVPYALSVPYAGITGFPTTPCGAGQFATGFDVNGNLVCATPGGGGTTYTGTAPVAVTGTVISMSAANTTTPGYLTQADYVAFAGKQARVTGTCPAGSYITAIDAVGAVTCGVDQVGGGTLTGIVAGAGLTGGGSAGSPSIAIADGGVGALMLANGAVTSAAIADASIVFSKLSAVGCVAGDVIKYDGTLGWICAPDATGAGGGLSGITAGAGLSGGGTTGNVTLDIAPAGITSTMLADGSVWFDKLNQNGCAANQFPRWDGARWVCSTSFNDVGCGPGQVLKWNGAGFDCQNDLDSGTTYGALPSGGLAMDPSNNFYIPTGAVTSDMLEAIPAFFGGTFTQVIVDAKGRVTGANTPTTLAEYGITDAVRLQPAGGAVYQNGDIAVANDAWIGRYAYATTFYGSLSGYASNAVSADTATSATSATSAGSAAIAGSVSSNSIYPDSLNALTAPLFGQVPAANVGTFEWITPLTGIAAGTGITAGSGSVPTVSVDTTAVPLLASDQTFSGANTFSSSFNSFSGSGSGLTGLNASSLASGTVPSARVSGAYTGITQVGTLTGLATGASATVDLGSSNTVNANNAVFRNIIPAAVVQTVTYQGVTVDDVGTPPAWSNSDGLLTLSAGTVAGNARQIRNYSPVGFTTSGPGSFLSFRAYTYYIGQGSPPAYNGHHAWITAGGASHGGGSVTGGYGFHIYTSGGVRYIDGVTYGTAGTSNAVLLVSGHSPNISSFLAVNRGSQIDFFIDGTFRGSISTASMNTSTFGTYAVRVQTDVAATTCYLVLNQLTVGQGL